MSGLTREQIKEMSNEQIQIEILSAKRKVAFWFGVQMLMAFTILLPFTILVFVEVLCMKTAEYFPSLTWFKKIGKGLSVFLEWCQQHLSKIKFIRYPIDAESAAHYSKINLNDEVRFRIYG